MTRKISDYYFGDQYLVKTIFDLDSKSVLLQFDACYDMGESKIFDPNTCSRIENPIFTISGIEQFSIMPENNALDGLVLDAVQSDACTVKFLIAGRPTTSEITLRGTNEIGVELTTN